MVRNRRTENTSLCRLINMYCKIKYHKIYNLISLLRRNGFFIGSNGFKFEFNKVNKKDIMRLFYFSIAYGVKFSLESGFWCYNNGLIILPNGIRFYLEGFNSLVFAETFLYDIHFVNFDLKGKVVVQAGGFIGDTALYYASKGAEIYSFEPDSISFDRALTNIKLNPELSKNIVMKNYAVGEDGEISFPINPEGSIGSSMFETEGKDTIRVKSVSVRTILNEFDIHDPYLLDLDIKGNEFDVLADESVSKFKIIRIEYSQIKINKNLGNRDEIIKKLQEYNFNNIRIFKQNQESFDLSESGVIEAIKFG